MYLMLILGVINGIVGFGQNGCELDSLSVTSGPCIDGAVDITINFVPADTRSARFTVSDGDVIYGTFEYSDLPVTIEGVVVDSNRTYIFKIADSEVDTCGDIFEYGRFECKQSECSIQELKVEVLDSCSYDGQYAVMVDFIPQGFTRFDVYANWEFFGSYGIDELPLHIADFPSRNSEWDLIKISANDTEDCYELREFLAPICKQTECGISELEVKVVECDDSSFFVKMDLEHYGPHSTTFVVTSNFDNAVAYPYSVLPITLGPYPIGTTDEVVFLVADLDDTLCQLEKFLDDIPCRSHCAIGDISSTITRCDSGSFDVLLSFDLKDNVTDSFFIRGNGNTYGRYSYSDVPVQLSDLPAGTGLEYEFLVVDQNDEGCYSEINLGPIDCRCYFPNLYVGGSDCTSDSTYAVVLRFDLDAEESFSVNSCGIELGTYTGADLPLRIADFPASGADRDVIHICFGSEESSCCLEYEIVAPECARKDCIFDLSAVPGPCMDNGEFYVEIDFTNQSAEDEHRFFVKKYGQIYGEFSYGDLPVKVGPFPKHQNADTYVLDISDANNECHVTVEVDVPDCGCDLRPFNTKVSCATDSTYELKFDLEIAQDFEVYVNGDTVGVYSPNDLPLVLELFVTAGEKYDYIQICGKDGICCADLKVEVPDCLSNANPFSNLTYEVSECDPNNGFFVLVDFETNNVCSDSFFIKGAGEKMKFSYDELPVRIGPLLGGSEFYRFELYDAFVDRCNGAFSLGRVVCPQQCDFSSAEVFTEDCTDEDHFILVIDSLMTNFPAFDLYYDSIPLGFFKTEELPLRIKVPTLDMDSVSIFACVSDNTSCCYTVMIPVPQCTERTCDLSDLRADTIECRGDSLWVNLSFEHGESDSLFQLFVNEQEYGVFDSEEIPFHVGPFFTSDNSSYEFVVQVLGHPDCASNFKLEEARCPGSDIAKGVKVLILQSDERNIFVKVPDFISERTDLQLFDLQGRLIHNSIFSSNDIRAVVRTPQMVSGMYVVRLLSKDGVQFSQKIIVP